MKAKIHAYREIKSADIQIDLIALIQGSNKAGKTSIASAIRGAVTGDPAPDVRMSEWIKWNKGEFKALVNDSLNSSTASCVVESSEGAARMVWPDGKFETKGREPRCSPTAAGVWSSSLASVSPMKRGPALVDMLSGLVAEEDLLAYLGNAVPEKVAKEVWNKSQEAGWDVALDHAAKKLRGFKAEWETITRDKWGPQKAQSWRPLDWNENLERLTPQAAQASIDAAAAQLQQLGVDSAVTQAQIATLKTQADQIPAIQEEIAGIEKMKANLEAELTKLNAELRAVPPAPNSDQELACPSCGTVLHLIEDVRGHVTERRLSDKIERVDQAELKKRRQAKAGLEGQINKAEADKRACENRILLRTRDLESAQAAAEKLSKIREIDPAKITDAQRMLEKAQANYNMVAQVQKAWGKQNVITIALKIVDALDPKGVRRTVMLRKLGEFNERLAHISTQVGIGHVKIDGSTFEIMIGSRLYRDESDSEQFRARVVMQVATAEVDGSSLVIIDNDVDMDTKYYQRLLGMLLKRNMPAIVSMRVNSIDKAMNTAKANVPEVRERIKSYWVENGTATLLQAQAQQAAE